MILKPCVILRRYGIIAQQIFVSRFLHNLAHKLSAGIYADIIINDSVKIGRTGLDGCFRFEVSLPVNKLTFQSIGYEFADLKITEDCNYIELIMVPDFTYCFMSYRKINKERRKLYKKLPELHQEAYEKGIFQSPEVCYIQEFIEFKE